MTTPAGRKCEGYPVLASRWSHWPAGTERPPDGTVTGAHGWCKRTASRELNGHHFCGTHANVAERERVRIAGAEREQRRRQLQREADTLKTALDVAVWSFVVDLAKHGDTAAPHVTALMLVHDREVWLAKVSEAEHAS